MAPGLRGGLHRRRPVRPGRLHRLRPVRQRGLHRRRLVRQRGLHRRRPVDNAAFTGDAWFSEATFKGLAGFRRTAFSSGAWFHRAAFTGAAWFRRTAFSSVAAFDEATFSREASFRRATFSRGALFEGVTFNGDAGFGRATFTGGAWFGGATTFNGDALFVGTIFNGGAVFDGATFNGLAGFGTTFGGGAGYRRTNFNDVARFVGATVSGDERSLSFNKHASCRPTLNMSGRQDGSSGLTVQADIRLSARTTVLLDVTGPQCTAGTRPKLGPVRWVIPRMNWGLAVVAGFCSGYFKVSGIGAPMRSKACRWALVGSASIGAVAVAPVNRTGSRIRWRGGPQAAEAAVGSACGSCWQEALAWGRGPACGATGLSCRGGFSVKVNGAPGAAQVPGQVGREHADQHVRVNPF